MQSIVYVLVQQMRQAFAVSHSQRLCRQVFQDLLRVVGAAEESAVQSGPHSAMHLCSAGDQQDAECRSYRYGDFRSCREAPCVSLSKPQGEAYGNQQHQDGESALDQQVARAAPQKYRDIHHPVLHYGVSEGQRNQEQECPSRKTQPERHFGVRKIMRNTGKDGWCDSDHRPPEHHLELAPVFNIGGANHIPQKRDNAEQHRPITQRQPHKTNSWVAEDRAYERQRFLLAVADATPSQAGAKDW
jgi:hypothetical protein